MGERRPEQKLFVPIAVMVTIAVTARLGFPLLIALLILPLIAVWIEDSAGIFAAAAVCATAGVAGGMILPPELLPLVIVWCVGVCCAACIPVKKATVRFALWAGASLAAWMTMLIMLWQATGGQPVPGLAKMMTDVISQSPERDTFLLNAYSMGLSRLKGTAGLIPALRVMGSVVIAEATRNQLLWSLRVSLERQLPSLMCDAFVLQTALTAVLPSLMKDSRLRRRGEKGLMPPPEKWYIPRRWGMAILALALGGLFAVMSDGGVDRYMGLMCYSVFRLAFIGQGLCLLLWLEKRMGIRSTARSIWAVVLSVILPVIPLVMGMIDQSRDGRNLRPKKEAGQE